MIRDGEQPVDTIKQRLQNLSSGVRDHERKSDVNTTNSSPKSTLEIQDQESSEVAWQKYLKYFFDPSEPHELGTALLESLIYTLQENKIIDPGLETDLEEVIVRQETQGSDSRPDLLLYEPGEWFICFELKIYHHEREGQTKDHVDSPELGELTKKTIPSENHYYLYVAPRWSGDGDADEFQAFPWMDTDENPSVANTVSTAIERIPESTPTRTEVQLREFQETVTNELTMNSINDQTRQLKELYINYKSDIDRVENAFEEYTTWFFENRVPSALNSDYSPSYWSEEWEYKPYSGYTQICRPSWKPGKGIDVHMEFYPDPEKLIEGKIRLRFDIEYKGEYWESDDGRRPQQVFADEVLDRTDTVDLPEHTTVTKQEDSSAIHKLFETHYEFQVNSDEDYLAAFQSALEDMAPIVPAVNDTIEHWDNIQ